MRAVQKEVSNTPVERKGQNTKLVQVSARQEAVLRKQYNAEKPLWRRPALGYLLCIPLVGIAILGTLFLKSMVSMLYFPEVLLILSVLFSALIWGVGPSLFALVLATLLLDYYFVPPVEEIQLQSWNNILQLLPFVLAGLVVALITAQRESARLQALIAEQELHERAEQLEQTNNRLEQTNHQLKEANQLKDRFISIASHELKTPITTIRGQAQLVLRRLSKQRDLNPDMLTMRTTLEKINDQTSRITALVDELLDMSSIRAGKVELRKKECDLVDICRGVIEDQHLLSGRDIKLAVQSSPVTMLVDCDRIAQVIVNLVSNATKYSPEGSPVEVSISRNDGTAQVAVRDSGKGITKKQQEHIFESFYRTPEAQSSSKSGLGLGLAISKDIVERHNGRIWCESEPSKGSTFYVELPLK